MLYKLLTKMVHIGYTSDAKIIGRTSVSSMRVNGLGQVSTSRLKSKKAGGGGFVDSLDTGEADAASAKSAVANAGPVSTVGALLSLQEVPDSTDGRSRGLARAEDMLKGLEDIRKGLLSGVIPQSQLRQLEEKIREQREYVQDPRLGALLDDVELRVAVELAKLEQGDF